MIISKIVSFIVENSKQVNFLTETNNKVLFITEATKTVNFPIDITPAGTWILATGSWNDSGVYDDFNVWID